MNNQTETNRLFQIIFNLSKANFLTGYWDTLRGKLAQNYIDDIGYFKETEIKSRKYCELRCKWRTEIDILIEDWINIWKKK